MLDWTLVQLVGWDVLVITRHRNSYLTRAAYLGLLCTRTGWGEGMAWLFGWSRGKWVGINVLEMRGTTEGN